MKGCKWVKRSDGAWVMMVGPLRLDVTPAGESWWWTVSTRSTPPAPILEGGRQTLPQAMKAARMEVLRLGRWVVELADSPQPVETVGVGCER